jgi:hypothetical protein
MTVIVDFQGTVAGRGSHIDLKIDSGSYVPVASPHTITRLSDGPHMIYLRAADKEGHVVDPIYTGELDVFIVIKVKTYPSESGDYHQLLHKRPQKATLKLARVER